jgi:hypothetical protein
MIDGTWTGDTLSVGPAFGVLTEHIRGVRGTS